MKTWIRPVLFGCLSFLVIVSCDQAEKPGQVTLNPGDNFQLANDEFPAGTVFLVKAGVHKRQKVNNPKPGNVWLGEEGAVMDGDNVLSAAFTGGAYGIVIQGIEIKKYLDNGIYFKGGKKVVLEDLSITDTGSGNGESNGAIRLDHIEDITVSNNYFLRVSSAILPSFCTGPVAIEWNNGIDIGRNFVQLRRCRGESIRVQYNTMERRSSDFLRKGAHDVEDWISVYKSDGTPDDPIRISYNRAKGHGPSRFGSFIMLGDGGGRHQVAEGNVGVTPGQVGIGIAGGEDITVRGNILYSDEWEGSNVAFYSAYRSKPAPCTDHVIKDNLSLWYNKKGNQNNLHTDHLCNPVIQNNKYPDFSLNHRIWESAKAAIGK